MPYGRVNVGSVLLFALFVACTSSPARAETLAFREFGPREGLSQNSVGAIAQTPDGVLWFGTQAGLNRYDGRSFEIYGPRHGLPSGDVVSLTVDGRGVLWVGTTRGLARGPVDGRFDALDLDVGEVRGVAEGDDGTFWFATDRGLARWDRSAPSVRWIHTHVEGTQLTSVAVDGQGRVVVSGAKDSVSRLERGTFRSLEVRGEDPPLSGGVLSTAPDGTVWHGSVDVLVALDDSGRRVELERAGAWVRQMVFDDTGSLWCATSLGVVRVQGSRQRWIDRDHGLPFRHAQSVLFDHEGSVWIGGAGGLAQWSSRAFATYTTRDGLPSDEVRPILRTRDGRLLVGTRAGLVVHQDDEFERVGDFEGNVLSLLEHSSGTLYVGTSEGLHTVDAAGVWARVEIHESPEWVDQIVEDQRGWIWLAARRQTPHVSTDGEAFRPVDVGGRSFRNGRILAHSSGDVLVSSDDGLCRFDGVAWTVLGVDDGLASPEPYFLVEGPRGAIWFGYHEAVGFSRLQDGRVTTWSSRHGLTDANVYSLGFDGRGHLWLGTSRGVDRFDGQDFVHFDPDDGYAGWESNSNGFHLDDDGTLWFATASGLSHFDPRVPTVDRPVPRLRLRTLTLDGRPVSHGAEFAFGDHDLFFDLVLSNYVRRDEIEVRYRVLGFGDAWEALPNLRARVPRLGAGDYRLEVQARAVGEPWQTQWAREWVVAGPWWRSGSVLVFGAFVVLGVMTLGMGYAVAFGRSHLSLARRGAEFAGLQSRVTELEAECERLETLGRKRFEFVANMSHEIRTPLSGVIGMVSLLRETDLDEEQQQFTDIVQRSGDQLLGVVNEVLDLTKLESGRLELDDDEFDLRAVAEAAVGSCTGRAVECRVDIVLDVDPRAPRRVRGDGMRLQQVLVNLVGNAVKFSEGGTVTLRIDRVEGPRLRFEVEDDGIGIAEDRIAHLFDAYEQAERSTSARYGGTGLGLAIADRIVRLMGGWIEVSSTVGEGSTFRFTVRADVVEDAPEAAGSGRGVAWILTSRPTRGRSLERTLSAAGFEAEVRDRRTGSIPALAQERPDLVVVDEGFADLGLEALVPRVLDGGARAVVALQSLGSETVDLGPAVRLRKPVAEAALLDAVERALERAPEAGPASTVPPGDA